jgi:hypothetical protein
LVSTGLTDNPVIYTGRGSTELTLELLFDVGLAGSSIHTDDVRDLTRPLWELAEYRAARRRQDELPQVRFIWGKSWNMPAVVASIAERFERFTRQGIAQRSWLTMRLLRVSEDTSTRTRTSVYDPTNLPELSALQPDAESWETHSLLGGGVDGESLWELASQYYGDPGLWRLIAVANEIDDPGRVSAGTMLQIPPHTVLQR